MSLHTLLDTAAIPWLVCALIALGTEFMTGTLYLLVFAIALAGGGVAALFAAEQLSQFLAASLAGIVAFAAVLAWKRRQPPVRRHAQDDPDLGQEVRVVSVQAADPSLARVFYRGAQWDARLIDPAPSEGQMGFIVGRDGNLLHVSRHLTEGQ
ncbi:MAG: NfeD family protein [Paludibacterium sp.]|uniref:NfeD family protein n=1 Tax=Paludibacterium sp. TaxID=1917523 RepID=UPI0025EA603B|nr:NfeD family protein [Paludibacterium sp.]MBV8048861.1 NfeD family protein [Paludibacterium sp.]MBV8646482.1 NfeD family protein [Paludibacterium sp.]